ncbi:MAG: hypothetical protein L6R39_001851 [Caloplaca ligustica]|nr:MAG: hypothetical protein L6R39_001851 [Caloplaca ligustica]
MKPALRDRLLRRELGHEPKETSIRGLYGDRSWIEDLDIVNELGGHSGCVNALSWSTSGRLLASGSDDQHLNIHSYQPDSSTAQFALNITVSTGHSANIFSVKFMPHSNDRTIVTAAGDAEVRVFDIEKSGRSTIPSGAPGTYKGVQYLSYGDTNTRIYRSHADRVKRIVTESSPFLFLLAERGGSGSVTPLESMSSAENEAMSAATRCVRRFAPNNKRRMKRTDNGHITACKISDANPNELIASWSGDQIYSFDILRSPDAADGDRQGTESPVGGKSGTRVKATTDRKRKRKQAQAPTSTEQERRDSRPRRSGSATSEAGDLALRVRYENGQSEDIAMSDPVVTVPSAVAEEARESVLNESQQRSLRIAKSVVKIRKLMFSLSDSSTQLSTVTSHDPSGHRTSFTSILGFAAQVIPEMDEISRSWRYPIDPREEDIVFQQTLRGHRDSSRRFVQAAGTLARGLGGRLQTGHPVSHVFLQYFSQIEPAPHEGPNPPQQEIFSFDFLKAILLWLDGGPQALLQGFKRPPNQRKANPRYPIPDEADHGGIDEYLIPYLLRMASSRPIPNVDASRFEKDEYRQVFPSETGAVIAFSSSIQMELKDLSRAIMPSVEDPSTGATPVAQDKKAALNFWGFKVGRGLLMNAGKGINFQYVDIAFGGLGTARIDEGREQEDIDPDEMEDVVHSVSVVTQRPAENGDNAPHEESAPSVADGAEQSTAARSTSASREASVDFEDAGSDAEVVLVDDLHNEIAEHMAEHDENEHEMDDDDEDNDDDNDQDDEDDAGDSDEDITAEERQFIFRSASDRGKSREMVEVDVPYSSHTRSYTGHCNVRTVKDANFFGLSDEYVVSGSDSGHVFIWDKRTSELVNILQGDGEIVNVVQGHPYEPVLAVSGIDSTIKIFSPDRRAQDDARAGINVGYGSSGLTTHSSLSGVRRRVRRASSQGENGSKQGLESCKRMDQREQIMRENDVQRQGGMREAYITRGMLAQLSARLRVRQAAGGGGEGGEDEGEGVPIMIDDNCEVM